jgi:hypothetical protein
VSQASIGTSDISTGPAFYVVSGWLTLSTGNYALVGKLYVSRSAGSADPASLVTCYLVQNNLHPVSTLDKAEVSFAAAETQTQIVTLVSTATVYGTTDSFSIQCQNQTGPDATAMNIELIALQVNS